MFPLGNVQGSADNGQADAEFERRELEEFGKWWDAHPTSSMSLVWLARAKLARDPEEQLARVKAEFAKMTGAQQAAWKRILEGKS